MSTDPSTWSLTDAQNFLNAVAQQSGMALPFPPTPVMGYGTQLPGTVAAVPAATAQRNHLVVFALVAFVIWRITQ